MFPFISVMKHDISRSLLPLLKNLYKKIRPFLYYSRMHILTVIPEEGLKIKTEMKFRLFCLTDTRYQHWVWPIRTFLAPELNLFTLFILLSCFQSYLSYANWKPTT